MNSFLEPLVVIYKLKKFLYSDTSVSEVSNNSTVTCSWQRRVFATGVIDYPIITGQR